MTEKTYEEQVADHVHNVYIGRGLRMDEIVEREVDQDAVLTAIELARRARYEGHIPNGEAYRFLVTLYKLSEKGVDDFRTAGRIRE